ncbi:MAG: amidohydrolase family protein [Rectinema sp.]|jgi:allantoinase
MIITNVAAALPGERDFRLVDIFIKEGKITAIKEAGTLKGAGGPNVDPARSADEEILDAKGLLAFPGAIDPHVHFDEPGFTHREDFMHGSAEAARGGVTTVIDMPCTSIPPVTAPHALEEKLSIVREKALVDFAFYGGINGHMKPEDIPQVVESLAPNVVGFKSYFISGMDTFPAVDEAQFAAAAQACAKGGRPLLLHAEDPDVIAEATRERAFIRGTQKHQWIDYYASRPMDAEMAAVLKALKLAGQYAKNIHIVHVGTAKAAIAVSERGATCETCAHYLAFDETDFARLGAALKTAPPVKAPEQKAMLWHLLADGQIGFVTSDHAGAPEYEKYTDDPLTAYGGIPGTGTLFPYLLSEGLFAKRLPLERFLEATSGGAARRYGLWQAKGSLLPGKDADFVLVDPDHTSRVIPSNMMSKSAITPFAGMLLSGRIEGTFVRGSCVYASVRLAAALGKKSDTIVNEAGMILARPGFGKFLTWGYR